MKKFFISNLLFLLSLNILIKSFWILGIDRSVQNALPYGEYGLYFALLNFTYIFNIILDLGITNFNNRTIAQNTVLLKIYFSRILPLKLILSLVYLIILFTIAWISGYDAKAFHLLFWLAVFQILTSLITYLRSNISALLLFKVDSIISVMDKALTIIFCSILLWTSWGRRRFCLDYFIYAQILSLTITALTAFTVCLVKSGFIRLKWNKNFMLAILRYGFPFALLTLLMSFYNRLDSVMLERILKDDGIASEIYASGFRLIDSVNMIAYLFSVILLPLFAKMIKDHKDVTEIVKISFHILLLVSFGFAIVSYFYSYNLMDLLYTKHIPQSASVYKILCFCFIPVSMTYIFGTLLTANGSLKKLNIVASCGMLLNIGVNILLIPHFKEIGSAFAALTAQVITALLQIWIALKTFEIKVSKIYIIKIFCFILSLFICAWTIKQIHFPWQYKAIGSLGVFCLLSLAFKLFRLQDFALLLKSKIDNKKTE